VTNLPRSANWTQNGQIKKTNVGGNLGEVQKACGTGEKNPGQLTH